MDIMGNKNEWDSNRAFILAMIGSAVGLGNIWRYPYVLYSNGGGEFYIPYLISILVLAIPFTILEYGVGYNYRSSFTKAIIKIHPKLEYYGWILPVVVFMMTIYYSTIIGWDGIYFILSFFKGWGSDPNAFLSHNILQSTDSLGGIFHFLPLVAISMLVVWFIVWLISHKNLDDGLGKVSKIFVPILFITMIIIVIYSLTLPGANIGLNELFKPDYEALWNIDIWVAAFGQIFFSLSLGMGAGFTYASYTKKDIDLVTSGLYVVIANSLFENFAAFGVFAILGHMSLQSGIPIEKIVAEGASLIFVTYPQIFNILGVIALILGPLFFFTVYVAGITSMLSSFEVLSISIQNKFNMTRKKTTSILVIVGALASMIYATSCGEYILTITDNFVNNFVVIFSVIIECILFTWIFKAEKLIKFLNSKSKTLKLGKWWIILLKYLIPILLCILWIGGITDIIKDTNNQYILIFVILLVILLIFTLILTVLRPKSQNWFKTEERIK